MTAKMRRNYRGENPTQAAVVGHEPRPAKPKDNTPKPTGGVVIAPEARQACTLFGLHPYQVSEIMRQAGFCKRDHFKYQGREIDLADNGQVVIVERVH